VQDEFCAQALLPKDSRAPLARKRPNEIVAPLSETRPKRELARQTIKR